MDKGEEGCPGPTRGNLFKNLDKELVHRVVVRFLK